MIQNLFDAKSCFRVYLIENIVIRYFYIKIYNSRVPRTGERVCNQFPTRTSRQSTLLQQEC